MFYSIQYYMRKYWYFVLLILVIIAAVLVLFFTEGGQELLGDFSISGKVEVEGAKVESSIDSDSYLDGIEAENPYLGTYIPGSAGESDAEKELFEEAMEKDPRYIYKKQIDWSQKQITNDQCTELTELVGWDLNKDSINTTYIVRTPTPEELEEANGTYVYYVDDNGILYLTLHVDEVNKVNDTSTTYVKTFKLQYDMEGYVNIS